NGARLRRQCLRHPPASDVQWEALLVPRVALRRSSLRSLRESQPLRRICRISPAPCACSIVPGQGAARAPRGRWPFRSAASVRAFPLSFAGRYRQFLCAARAVRFLDLAPPGLGKAPASRRGGPAGGASDCYLAWRWPDLAALLLSTDA